jgi:hypothetical protein
VKEERDEAKGGTPLLCVPARSLSHNEGKRCERVWCSDVFERWLGNVDNSVTIFVLFPAINSES